MSSIQPFFYFSPQYSTWESFNGALLMIYDQEPIPYYDENNWKIVADSLSQLPTFLVYPVSSSQGFETWQDWADNFTQIVNGPSQ